MQSFESATRKWKRLSPDKKALKSLKRERERESKGLNKLFKFACDSNKRAKSLNKRRSFLDNQKGKEREREWTTKKEQREKNCNKDKRRDTKGFKRDSEGKGKR